MQLLKPTRRRAFAQAFGSDFQIRSDLILRWLRIDAINIADSERIANAVGLALGVFGNWRRREGGASAAATASRTASSSFRDPIPPDALVQALVNGVAPPEYTPHIRALLDEAPIGILADMAYELQDQLGTPPSQTWQRMRNMAASLRCLRDIWN